MEPHINFQNQARQTAKKQIYKNNLPRSHEIISQNYDTLMVIGAFSLVIFYLLLMLLSSSDRRPRRNGARIGERGQLVRRVNQEIRQRGENVDLNIINENNNNRVITRENFNETMPSIARMREDPNQDQEVTDRLIDIDQERRRRLARRNISSLRREIKKAVKKRSIRKKIGEEILAMETEDEMNENENSSSGKVKED